MPELPEVETVMRGLAPALLNARIEQVETRRPDLRFPLPKNFAARLTGRRVDALSRRAKYILADLDDGAVLVMHLGMTGRFQVGRDATSLTPGAFYYDGPRDAKHDHVVFRLSNGAVVTFNDARRFGFMDLVSRADLARHRAFASLGIEPLGNELSGQRLCELFDGRRTSLKAALMDQRLVAGLGNIYVCEALFRARLSPTRAAGTLTKVDAERLAEAIRAILTAAVEAGGSSFRTFTHADGGSGAFQEDFAVYGREGAPCPVCGRPITRLVQANRSTFHCARCQR